MWIDKKFKPPKHGFCYVKIGNKIDFRYWEPARNCWYKSTAIDGWQKDNHFDKWLFVEEYFGKFNDHDFTK